MSAAAGVAATPVTCADCDRPIEGDATCTKCVEKATGAAFDDGAAEAAEDGCDHPDAPAAVRNWMQRKRLLGDMPADVAVWFELLLADLESGDA